MKRLNFKYLLFSFFIAFTVSSTAQENYSLDIEGSQLIVAGTSSIHEWEMEAETFSAQTTLDLNENGINEVRSIIFTCRVEDMESGKRIMNNKAHEALQEKDHPEISFKLEQNDVQTVNAGKVSLTGDLTIAGQTKEVTVESTVNVTSDSQFSVQGELPLKMSDFGIEPPTAMLGTLETGDDVVVKFDFWFSKASEVSGL